MNAKSTPYKILGVSQSASDEEVKKAYRKLAQMHHPDRKGGDSEKFKEVQEAYDSIVSGAWTKQQEAEKALFDSEVSTILTTSIRQALQESIDRPVLARLLHFFDTRVEQLHLNVKNYQGKLKSHSKARNRFKNKQDGKQSLVLQILETEIHDIQEKINSDKYSIKLCTKAKEILSDEVEEFPDSAESGPNTLLPHQKNMWYLTK